MAAPPPTDPDREYRLIEQLELRVASANTDEKFEAIVQKFLAALLQKVGSPTARNKNLAIKVCQHILQRLKIDDSIDLPTKLLLKTFREDTSTLVKQFALVFVEQGLSRVQASDRAQLLPELLQLSIPEIEQPESSDSKLWSIAFDFLLAAFAQWHIPDHSAKEAVELGETFRLTKDQRTILSRYLSHFLLFDSRDDRTSQNVDSEFVAIFDRHQKTKQHIVLPIAKFLFLPLFDDENRFVPATVLSVDVYGQASVVADTMFKQCAFDLESDDAINALFALFDMGKPKLQIRCLNLLTRSRNSTRRASKIMEITEKQLFKDIVGLEGLKFRSALFAYLNWTIRMSNSLGQISHKLQTILKEFIEIQGWPSLQTSSVSEIDLRAKAYEAIGLLATVKSSGSDQLQNVSIDMITWLFTSLRCDTSKDIKTSIDESLSRILGAATFGSAEDLAKLKNLLSWNVSANIGDEDPIYFHPTQYSTRYLAVRFANKCIKFSDVDARSIDLIALGFEDRREVAEEALRGLDPYWHSSKSFISQSEHDHLPQIFPDLRDYVREVFGSGSMSGKIRGSATSLSAAAIFGRNLLVTEALRETILDVRAESEWQTKINALVRNDNTAREAIKRYISRYDAQTLLTLLENCIFGVSQGLSECSDAALELLSMTPATVLLQLKPIVLEWCQQSLGNGVVQLQASRIIGMLGSLSNEGTVLSEQFLSRCAQWEDSIGQDAILIRGQLLAAAYVSTRRGLRQNVSDMDPTTHKVLVLASSIISQSRDKALAHAAYTSLGQICLCNSVANANVTELSALQEKFIADAKKESEIALTGFGRFANATLRAKTKTDWSTTFEPLFALHDIRKAEFQFAVGEALAVAALGFHSLSTITEFDVDAPFPDWGQHSDLFLYLLDRCIKESHTTKPSLKKAAAIWLLCLIQYCGDAELLKGRLRACQAAFTGLLSDRDEVVQEAGSRGLGIVYDKGDRNLRDDLVRDLVQTFTGGAPKMSGTVNEETELFEAGTLPTEGGQSVTTYKDIVSLATEMGDPSLVYRFMNLASNNAIWSSRAAFGRFGLSGVLSDSTYLTENKKFYPKLFRYRFDPNPNVRRSMDDIWKALVKDPNKVIEENFDVIMDDLLHSVVSGKEWRAREASCGAIADLVQGREVEKFERYLDNIWTVAFKVLDDVKETVRIAALKLCRTLTNMLIRNLEVGDGTTKRATTMLSHAVPFLLQQMEHGTAQEVQQNAVVTMLEVVKKSPLRSLQPFAPLILETLVLSLSSLEHESINYLHLNADKYGLTAEKLDKMRVSSINASPLTDAIERCLESLTIEQPESSAPSDDKAILPLQQAPKSASAVADAMKRLEKAFKTAIGLPSKVGLSRVMITLVVRHHAAFRPFADRFVRLTRKYILDRNATISVSFSMALAYLIRLASEKEVQETYQYAQKLYFESQELSHRAIGGEIVQAISKASNDVFMRYGSTFLPFAFIGRQDLDEDVRSRFDPPWKDNIGGARALNLYLPEIVALIGVHIGSSLWPIKQACCLAVADLISSMATSEPYTSTEAQLLWTVIQEALGGKTWEGKQKVILAYPIFVNKSRAIWPEHDKKFKAIALREAERQNAAYRPHAIEALGEFALNRDDLDLSGDILQLLTTVSNELDNDDDVDAMEVDGDESSGSRLVEETRVAMVKCLFNTLSAATDLAILDEAVAVLKTARNARTSAVDIEVYDSARRLISRAPVDAPSLDGRRRTPDADGGLGRRKRRNLLEAFLPPLITATFSADCDRHNSDSEKLRKARVDLALIVAERRLLSTQTGDILVSILKTWIRAERSRLLQTDLDKAINAITKS